MRILKIDRKKRTLKLSLQALEDLWHLHKVLEEGDLIRARTLRKTAVKRGSEISEGEKKPVTLVIRLERTDFHPYTGRLRVSGTIVSGPEDIQLASHHTLTLEPGMELAIRKQSLKAYQIQRLEKSRVKEQDIFFVAIDRDGADFAGLKEYGLEMQGRLDFRRSREARAGLTALSSPIRQSTEEEDRGPFYQKILETIESKEEYGKIILCGPGFERENLLKFIKARSPALAAKVLLEHSSNTGRPGIQEVIKSSGDRILKESRIARETALVEQLLVGLRKGDLAVRGKSEVAKAAEYGALGTLLVTDTKVREYEPILDAAEKVSAKIAIISTEHQAGEQLLGLGGIAGLLRFRI